MLRIFIILLLIANSLASYGQLGIKYNFNYPDNHTDRNGLKQGDWYIYDTDSVLLYKVVYVNGISQNTTYFDLNGKQMEIPKEPLKAKLLNGDELRDPFSDKKLIMKAFKLKCHIVASMLIGTGGRVEEVRFLSGCSKKLNKTVTKYLNELKYSPATFNNEPIPTVDSYFYSMRN